MNKSESDNLRNQNDSENLPTNDKVEKLLYPVINLRKIDER